MLLADVAETAREVGATSSRSAKVALIATLLRRLEPEEVSPVVGFLVGWPRQGRIGVGWSALSSVEVDAASEPSITVLELDAAIEVIAATTGAGSNAARSALLTSVLRRTTAAEADFIRRLFLGDMRQGALEGVLTDAVAKAAGVPLDAVRRAGMLSGDLGSTATVALSNGEQGLKAVGLELFRPVGPMLASTAESVADALAGTGPGPASVEWKLDGVRIQVHRRGGEVRVYTRNLNDVTERLPSIVDVALRLPATQLVLDGEAIGLTEDMRPRLFQETMSDVGRNSGEADVVPFFFDVLHADGRDFIDLPLVQRAAVLQGVAGRWRIPSMVTEDAGDAGRFLDAALEAGHEGVMVKGLSSPYQAGRRGKAWRKVKPTITLDLVVLGAEWGHGRRQGWLSNLHLGARDSGGGFVMVGKTFKGLTDELLRWQTEKLQTIESRRSGITVFVRPELVVEIELDGVQASPRYPGGVALRFARVLRYRSEKRPEEADTIDAVRGLLAGPR
jgi:ATP-dependent DNA ligase I